MYKSKYDPRGKSLFFLLSYNNVKLIYHLFPDVTFGNATLKRTYAISLYVR